VGRKVGSGIVIIVVYTSQLMKRADSQSRDVVQYEAARAHDNDGTRNGCAIKYRCVTRAQSRASSLILEPCVGFWEVV
jgi:hypothetical protein